MILVLEMIMFVNSVIIAAKHVVYQINAKLVGVYLKEYLTLPQEYVTVQLDTMIMVLVNV